MITFNFNINSVSDLEQCLDLLAKKGLLSNNSKPIHSANPVASDAPKGQRGDHMRAICANSAAYLATLGLTKAPKATDEEKALQKKINTAREEAGQHKINFMIDLVEREKALLAEGYNIFENVSPESGDQSPEETGTDYKIDFTNPVV